MCAQRCLTGALQECAEPGTLLELLNKLPPLPAEVEHGKRPNGAHLEEGLALAIMAEVRKYSGQFWHGCASWVILDALWAAVPPPHLKAAAAASLRPVGGTRQSAAGLTVFGQQAG